MQSRRFYLGVSLLAMGLYGCAPSMGVGGMPMGYGGYGMMGMPMGGYYGGWGHTNVYAYNRTNDVFVANHNNAYFNGHGGGGFYHPGRFR